MTTLTLRGVGFGVAVMTTGLVVAGGLDVDPPQPASRAATTSKPAACRGLCVKSASICLTPKILRKVVCKRYAT
jgi:hypothetical protein